MGGKSLNDPVDALRFAVEFAQQDIPALRPNDMLAILKAVNAFVRRDGGIPAPGSGGRIDYRTMLEIQRRVFGVLESIVARAGRFTVAGDLVLSFWGFSTADGFKVAVGGSPVDRFLYQLVRVLEEAGVDRLERCPVEPCRRFFLKVGKKTCCSSTCYMRQYMRDHKE